MGIREKLNRNPAITTGATIAVIVIALIFIGMQMFGSRGPAIPTQAYYTIDDGKTWFADDIKKVPPFDHNGQQAVKVYIYKCGDGEPFVGHLERYTPEAKAKVEASRNQPPGQPGAMPPMMMDLEFQGREVKKPGDANWSSMGNMQTAQSIITPRCPEGQQVEVVMPK